MGSIGCIFAEDFDALRLEKNDLEWSRPCLDAVVGEAGNGGREVKPGDEGDFGDVGRSVADSGVITGELERLPRRPRS